MPYGAEKKKKIYSDVSRHLCMDLFAPALTRFCELRLVVGFPMDLLAEGEPLPTDSFQNKPPCACTMDAHVRYKSFSSSNFGSICKTSFKKGIKNIPDVHGKRIKEKLVKFAVKNGMQFKWKAAVRKQTGSMSRTKQKFFFLAGPSHQTPFFRHTAPSFISYSSTFLQIGSCGRRLISHDNATGKQTCSFTNRPPLLPLLLSRPPHSFRLKL